MARLRCVPLLITLATVVALPTTAASAGTYKVEMCKLADGTPTPASDWSSLSQNFCANTGLDGFFGFSIGYNGAGTSQLQTLSHPANTAIARADVWRAHDAPASSESAQPRLTTTWGTWGYTGGVYNGSTVQNPYDPSDSANRLSVTNPADLTVRYDCISTGPASPDACTGATYLRMYKLDLYMTDGFAPVVTAVPGGPLLGGGWLTGTSVGLSVGASDAGAGAYRAFVRDGSTTVYARLDSSAAECRDIDPAGDAYDFGVLRPCQIAATEYSPTFDLRPLGDGLHTNVTIGVEDAAGNETVAASGQTLRINAPGGSLADPGTPCAGGTVDDSGTCIASGGVGGGGVAPGGSSGGAPSAGATPASGGMGPTITVPGNPAPPDDPSPANGAHATRAAVLRAGFGGANKREVRRTYGRDVVVTGRLLTPTGAAISGAKIDVFSANARGAARRETSVVTDGDGSFAMRPQPGPSRTLRFSYRAFASDPDYAESYEVDLVVVTKAVLRATPRALRNKATVAFRGRVEGAPAGSRKVVEMQVRQNGRWLTFGTTRLRGERFVYRYRFTRTFNPQSYVFRAIVRGETGWPYETGMSNPVKVSVRP